ncbi:ABC-2 family transporter protein [Austwickia chelonae]|uniref:Uncharacterized protein n=1 Tax=Austwickia chelonae NBRC 105200 TaxID=1184607 RepID=K6V7R8_9MICO|nr:ABC-2 transporter permease [Austwickia chelonae]GAB78273.1 hypothetical protein AUCHE_08_05190 [Austwickia chelonae NBRC 105200]SEW00173.1 ABC-2 family transporter protein [Austwickia chelonae]
MSDTPPLTSESPTLSMLRMDLLRVYSDRRQIGALLICALGSGMAFGAQQGMLFLFIMGMMALLSLFRADETARISLLCDELPLKRCEVVHARYLLILVLLASLAGVGNLLAVVDSVRGRSSLDEALVGVAGHIGALAVVQSFLVPVIVRYGVQRANLFLFTVCGAALGVLVVVGTRMTSSLPLSGPPPEATWLAPVAVAASWWASYRITMRLYEHQDH